jgi:outer membrane protein assembly factor BamB
MSERRPALRAAVRATAVVAAVGAATVALGGCEKVRSGANPELPLWAKRPIEAMSILYSRPLTIAERKVGEEYERGQPEIDVRHRRVFVGSSDKGLYALQADDGASLWRFETLGAVQCEPLYDPDEDVVYFGSNDGALYKVRAIDGSLLWRFSTNSEVSRRPVLANGLLYAVNANDTVVAVDPATGKLRWTQHRTPALGMEIAGYAGPLVTSDRVYTAFSDGHVVSYDALDGSERWQPVDLSAEVEQTTGEIPRYLDVDTTPVLDTIKSGRVVFVAAYSGGVYALDAETGARVWANDRAQGVTELMLWQELMHGPRDGVGPVEPAREALIASSGTTGLWALSPEDGRELWRRELPEGGISAPVPIAGALMVSTTRYGLFLFSPLNGGVIDGVDTTGGLAMTPAAYGLRAFVLSNGGTFLGVEVLPPGKL